MKKTTPKRFIGIFSLSILFSACGVPADNSAADSTELSEMTAAITAESSGEGTETTRESTAQNETETVTSVQSTELTSPPTITAPAVSSRKEDVTGLTTSPQTESTVYTSAEVLSSEIGAEEDIPAVQGEENAVIVLSDNGISVSGTGAAASGSSLVIEKGGVYRISGSLTGQMIVDISKEEEAELILDGVTIRGSDKTGSPLYIRSADKVTLTLSEGTVNSFSDTQVYAMNGEDDPSACIYSEEDIAIKGTGSLYVEGNYKNGIQSKNDIKIKNGNITVTAINDGIKGKDSVIVTGGSVKVTCGGDGIVSTETDEEGKGTVSLSGGDVTVTAGGGHKNGAAHTQSFGWGRSDSTTDSDEQSGTSAKGIKASCSVVIEGGNVTIDSADDSLHTDDSLMISGGTLSLSSGDDGIHAENSITIDGGSCEILTSWEGIESPLIDFNGGSFRVTASDDGLNASDGSGSGNFMQSDGKSLINITGGELTVDSAGDGLDSNDSMTMSGGKVTVSGSRDQGNSALDYDGSFVQTGGVLAAGGSSGMAQTVTSCSGGALAVYFGSPLSAGSTIEIKDRSGSVLCTYVPVRDADFFTLSGDILADGSTYSLYVNGSKRTDVTLSGLTSIDDSGNAVQGFGGFPGMNGFGGRDGFGGRQGYGSFENGRSPDDTGRSGNGSAPFAGEAPPSDENRRNGFFSPFGV
ncbi:MAG: carbohydrate-binding domain-containing protein [Oscillospiraceae bacterium]|nr:carbohydrate-binding domain-containing protein [Oscillospiraceae bacterium]